MNREYISWKNTSSFNPSQSSQFMSNASQNFKQAFDPLAKTLEHLDKERKLQEKEQIAKAREHNTGLAIYNIYQGEEPNIEPEYDYDFKAIAEAKADYKKQQDASMLDMLRISIDEKYKEGLISNGIEANRISDKRVNNDYEINKNKNEIYGKEVKNKLKIAKLKNKGKEKPNEKDIERERLMHDDLSYILDDLGVPIASKKKIKVKKAGTPDSDIAIEQIGLQDELVTLKQQLIDMPEDEAIKFAKKKLKDDIFKNIRNIKTRHYLTRQLDDGELEREMKGLGGFLGGGIDILAYGAKLASLYGGNATKEEIAEFKKNWKYSDEMEIPVVKELSNGKKITTKMIVSKDESPVQILTDYYDALMRKSSEILKKSLSEKDVYKEVLQPMDEIERLKTAILKHHNKEIPLDPIVLSRVTERYRFLTEKLHNQAQLKAREEQRVKLKYEEEYAKQRARLEAKKQYGGDDD
jgi:hypothetical protein